MTTSDTPDQEPADPDTFIAHHPPERRATIERLRLLCVASLVSLIGLGVAGLLKHRLYTYRWLTLLIWLYFTEGVVRVTGDAGLSQILAGIEVALSVVLFTACSVYIRLRLRVLPPKPKKGAAA